MRRSPRCPSIIALLVLIASLAAASPAAAQAPGAGSPDMVISQVYGGGGNSGATLRNDFIELFNRGSAAVDVTGWSVQYASATGTSPTRTTLSGMVQPGRHYLVQQAAGTGGSQPLPGPDATGSIAMSATSGKVALVTNSDLISCAMGCKSDPDVRDFVGYGAANESEGIGPAPVLTNTTADLRRPAGRGCQDTDNNAGDFDSGPPNPRNSASPASPCAVQPPVDDPPRVVDTDPDNGQTGVPVDTDVRVTFSEPVDATDSAFGVQCSRSGAIPVITSASGDGTMYTLDLGRALERSDNCTVSVRGAQVSDRDAQDPPDNAADSSFSFTTQGFEGLRIHDVQGRQHLSPFRDLQVVSVPGVVTVSRRNSFYMQDTRPDADPRTSEAILVFGTAGPAVGTPVTVSGRVTEFRPGCPPFPPSACPAPNYDSDPLGFGDSDFDNLSTTEIVSPTVAEGGEAGPIAPTVLGRGGRVPPTEVIDDDTPDPQSDDPPLVTGNVEAKSSPQGVTETQDPTFDPGRDGIDFYESLEGMLTEIKRAVAVESTNEFGSNSEIPVLADMGRDAGLRTPRGGIIARSFAQTAPQEYRRGDFNPERLILNDPITREGGERAPNVKVRDSFTEPIRAVVDYGFGNYKFLALGFPAVRDGGLTPEVTKKAKRDELSVATYNVENLDPVNDAERIQRIGRQIVANLRSPDILGVEEIQDRNGEASGDSEGEETFKALIEAIRANGGPRYDFRQIDPANNQDGGVPNGNIRVGFLFRPDRGVAFVDRPTPAEKTATTPTGDDPAQPGAQLTHSPGRIDPTNPVWDRSRKPLAGEFRFRGEQFFVVANHFNSKGGDDSIFGRFQEPKRPTEVQRRGRSDDPQRGQAGVVNAFVRRLLDADQRANVVVLGDLNDFDFSQTLRVLERGGDRSRPELLNLWRTLPASERYSYVFEGNSQTLDHILVSPALASGADPALDGVHINAELFDEQESDHDPVIARLEIEDEDD